MSTDYSDTISKTITVLPKPFSGFASDIACQGTPSAFTNTTNTNGLSISSWQWDFGDGQTSSLQDPVSHGYLNPGNYNVKLIAQASNGCSDTLQKTAIVASYPVAAVTANAPLSYCLGDSVTLSVGYNNKYTYNWLLNGTSITNADSSKFVAKITGDYSVEVVNTVGNCKSTSDLTSVLIIDELLKPSLSFLEGSQNVCPSEPVVIAVSEYTPTPPRECLP